MLLTPGVYNSAYYEHSFLADKLGVELVEGRDLFVKDEIVYMRTTQGPRRVDVIYRRIDDDFIDPLTFRPDSVLGVAGPDVGLPGRQCDARQCRRHRHRRRQGGLQLHAGDREILSRRRAAIEERADLALPRGRASRLCARPSARTRGQGSARFRRLRHADRTGGSKVAIEQFRAKLKTAPKNFIAQPTLALSTCPTCVEQGVAPRHVDLRPFVLTGSNGTRIVPGGLTRVAMKEGSLVVNSSQGGGTKDTWVLDG